MAPKKAEVIDNPPVGSSSEEEESGSSGEESESSAEVSKKDESSKKPESDSEGESDSESDSESEPAKTSKQPVVAKAKPKTDSALTVPDRSTSKRPLEETESEVNKKLKKSSAEVSKKDKSSKKPESDSEGESDSKGESDSESEPAQTIKQPVVAKAKPKTSGSAVTVPESSTAKRPLKKAESEANKKLKTSETENVEKPITNDAKKISGDDAKKMFQRLFSETDEIALLQGMLDFTYTKGDPYEDSDAFCIYVKKLIHFDATKNQIVTKLQRLKKKFVNTVKKSLKKGKSEDDIVFAKDIDQKAFELARKIWGTNGVLASKSRKKLGGTPAPKDMKLATPKKPEEAKTPEKREAKVVNTSLSIGREIAVFFNAENSSSCGLDESTITAVWKKVVDGADKTEVEEKWKKIKAKQVELCLQRTQLVNETAKLIFKAYES